MEVAQQPIQEDRQQQACRIASERFRREPDWVTFYREVLGVGGIVDKLFPSFEGRSDFEKTEAFAEIQQMLAKLRAKRASSDSEEQTRVITVYRKASTNPCGTRRTITKPA